MKRPALKNKRVVVSGMAFRARKVFGSFEKHTPGQPYFFSDYAGALGLYAHCVEAYISLRKAKLLPVLTSLGTMFSTL